MSVREFLCMLPVTVARSSSDNTAICYVRIFSVLWMTSCYSNYQFNRMPFDRLSPNSRLWLQHVVEKVSAFVVPPTCAHTNKKLSYRRGTARCVVSVEILPIATQQCRNYLYDKSWPNRWYEVGDLVGGNA